MELKSKKKVGIVGGMGPAATCDLYNDIIELSPAKNDQEHIHIVIDSNTNIPDRTSYILYNEKKKLDSGTLDNSWGSPWITHILNNHVVDNDCIENPLDYIIESAQTLQKLDCDCISMPCITAHYFEEKLNSCVDIPFISITEAVGKALKDKNVKTTALLVTDGSLCGRVFEPCLNRYGIDIVYPNVFQQKLIMELIYDCVKYSNYNFICELKNKVQIMIDDLRSRGAQSFILGCTELPIAFKKVGIVDEMFIDSTLELAKATVNFAYNL